MRDAPGVHYFGYGSNVDPGTFLGRRRMRPLETVVARLDDWELLFDLPVGPGERGVANVRPRPGAHVWGVVYRITRAQAVHLDRTEGVDRGGYRRVWVEVAVAGGESRRAYTLHAPHARGDRKPSRRYLGLLLAGARHHGLPDEWIATLRAIPLAVDERERQGDLFGGDGAA